MKLFYTELPERCPSAAAVYRGLCIPVKTKKLLTGSSVLVLPFFSSAKPGCLYTAKPALFFFFFFWN